MPDFGDEEDAEMVRWCRACPAGALPPAIERSLGLEGCALLEKQRHLLEGASGWEALTITIPLLMQHTLRERAEERQQHAEELRSVRDECANDCKTNKLLGWRKFGASGDIFEWPKLCEESSDPRYKESRTRSSSSR